MLDMILLVLATCCDSLFMSIAYGVEGIKIPFKSMCMIAFCGTFFLGVSIALASFLSQWMPVSMGRWISFAILFLLGFTNLFQHQLKHYVRKHKTQPLVIKLQGISFVIDIFLDETEADQDHSNTISMKEALYLGVALSIDSLASGLAYGIGATNLCLIIAVSFSLGIMIIVLGCFIGSHLMKKINHDVSWISGCMLLVLAFMRLL